MGGNGQDEVVRKANGDQAGPRRVAPGTARMLDAFQCALRPLHLFSFRLLTTVWGAALPTDSMFRVSVDRAAFGCEQSEQRARRDPQTRSR